jgi:hypothetical protein
VAVAVGPIARCGAAEPLAAVELDLVASVDRTLADARSGGVPAAIQDYARPRYGMESDDVYYPRWLEGTWEVSSTATALIAPAGDELFGPPGALERARAAMRDPPLLYRAQFTRAPDGRDACICERAFTVASISRAAMGSDAVLGVGGVTSGSGQMFGPASSADELEVRIQPTGANGRRFRAVLQVLARTARAPDKSTFACAELTRQTIFSEAAATAAAAAFDPLKPAARSRPPAPSVKEIETVSTYELQPTGRVLSKQRTLTFLVADAAYTMPSTDLQALMRARAAGRFAVDARMYDLVYTPVVR